MLGKGPAWAIPAMAHNASRIAKAGRTSAKAVANGPERNGDVVDDGIFSTSTMVVPFYGLSDCGVLGVFKRRRV